MSQRFIEREIVQEAIHRGVITVNRSRITYRLRSVKTYDLRPEEYVRAHTIAWLVVERDYPPSRMETEVVVPRRTPSDFADIIVYSDDSCIAPYLVVENKAPNQPASQRTQWIEQGFGNANSLRAPFMLYDEGGYSRLYDVLNYPPTERIQNQLGPREALPAMYGEAPEYIHIAGQPGDIQPLDARALETAVRRVHSIIWAGGKRDPLHAFEEWSKLLLAKVTDERTTPNGSHRRFQVGTNETETAVANRIHQLFSSAVRDDPTIFTAGTKIDLSDSKVVQVVRVLQGISLTSTNVDAVGVAFEQFFGSVFRGELGQYFTRRELARFIVSALEPTHEDSVIDPTCGSGGFLLEVLLQVWNHIDRMFSGQSHRERLKVDFALQRVYGIEIHEILSRICRINLLLHHDGHTNIEGGRSCLDSRFSLARLNPPEERFSLVVGNPPFGDSVQAGDEDHLGENELSNFELADGRSKVDSEHIVLERAIALLEPGGRLGFVVPDGLLNNQGAQSNCPQVRRFLASRGRVLAVISLPDYAFRKSGAQNKTSILLYQKFTEEERTRFDELLENLISEGHSEDEAIGLVFNEMPYKVFMAEAEFIGYTPSGGFWEQNDLYNDDGSGRLNEDQTTTILGEYRRFRSDPDSYSGSSTPACMAMDFSELWQAHPSRRMDPKYHIFKNEEGLHVPDGWIRKPIGEVLQRRMERYDPSERPDEPITVLTIAQTGELSEREAGKGKNPPEWLAMYLEDSSSRWYRAHANDVVYSSIDLWKGCIAVVPEHFNNALVTSEFPIYEVTDPRLDPRFLSIILRSRHYRRAFRAITTGHSNRRRTQQADFEALEIAFPPDKEEQMRLIEPILEAQSQKAVADEQDKHARETLDRVLQGQLREGVPWEGAEDVTND